jgi:protein gp37
MNETIIGWTDVSWNPASGCSKVSDGCRFCYAATISAKFKQTTKPWTIQNEAENVVIKPHKLHEPYTLGDKSQRCFVNSTSDLFHRAIPDWYRAAIFCVMLDLPHIVFQVLTKRSEAVIDWPDQFIAAVRSSEFEQFSASVKHKKVKAALDKATTYAAPWGANIWQGVSVEDARVLQRIEHLRQSQAAVKFISAEPLLSSWGQVDLSSIDWIIAGGESGKHLNQNPERFMKQEWAREIKRLCIDQHIAFFYKQDSGHTTELRKYLVEEDGSLWRWNQYPDDFRPPMFVSDKDEPLQPVKFQHNAADPTAERSFDECLHLAHLAERAAYERAAAATAPHWSENAALAAAYWYDAAARLRPALPAVPHPGDDLEALRAGSDERIADTLAELVSDPDPDPIPSAPITKIEPDYADPFDLPLNAKVITLQQPYASAVMAGVKQIETRSWKTPYRGALVIHAGKAWNDDLKEKANNELIASALRSKGLDPNALPLGMALGVVILDAVTPIENVLPSLSDTEKAFGHYTDGNFAWCVSRPRLFREPLAVAGEQGLRDWSSYLAKIGKPVTLESITAPVETDAPPVTTVANFNHVYQHWNKATRAWDDPRYVYIGRYMPSFNLPSSIFANPFKIAKDTTENRAAAIEQYRGWIKSKLADQHEGEAYRRELEALRGKHLVCWCKSPDGDPAKSKACHGDILRELLGETVEHAEPPKPEAPSVQLSLFGDEVPAKKKTVYA